MAITEMAMDTAVMWGAFVVVVGILVAAAYGSIQEQREWERFKVAQNCKVTQKMRGDTVTTVAPIIGGNGGVAVGVSSTPDKTAWLCADGVTYWR
jgi:hypothetical protein